MLPDAEAMLARERDTWTPTHVKELNIRDVPVGAADDTKGSATAVAQGPSKWANRHSPRRAHRADSQAPERTLRAASWHHVHGEVVPTAGAAL